MICMVVVVVAFVCVWWWYGGEFALQQRLAKEDPHCYIVYSLAPHPTPPHPPTPLTSTHMHAATPQMLHLFARGCPR
jgi:hypothetical protein